jgi:hypothetical protein
MLNTFILPGILVFAVNYALSILIVKGLASLKFYRLLPWCTEIAVFLASTCIFYWFYSATPEDPGQRIFLIALTALVITWGRHMILYLLKGRKNATPREFFRWYSRQAVKRSILYGAALLSAMYLNQWHFSFDFSASRDVSATLSRFGLYAFWVCCLITAVYFISGLGLIVLASRSDQEDQGFIFEKISDLDMEDLFGRIITVVVFTAIMIDLLYLSVYFHMVWPALMIIGLAFFLPFYHENNKNRETLIDGLGMLIGLVYVGLILAVVVPASCMSIYHLAKILILSLTHGSGPTLTFFHALPMFKLLLAGMAVSLYLVHQKLADRETTQAGGVSKKP